MKREQKSKQHKIAIRRVSERQKRRDKEYRRACKVVNKRTVAEHGYLRCIFCHKPIFGTVDHHHVAGKQGQSDNGIDLYFDPEGIVPAHPICHRPGRGGYHDKKLHELPETIYFQELLDILRKVYMRRYTDWMIKLESYEQKSDPLEGEY